MKLCTVEPYVLMLVLVSASEIPVDYIMLPFGAASLLRAAVSQCWLLTLLL